MQSVARLIADPGVMSSISAQSHTFLEIDHEIFFYAHSDPLADSRRTGVSSKQKYVHKIPINSLVKLAQEKVRID